MSVETPPSFLQSGSYGAEQTRRTVGALLARGSSIGSIIGGLIGNGDCALTPPGSGMSVNVAPGEIWVPGTTSATQSGYYCRVSSSTSLAIAASDPTNPRIDTVIAQVQDAAYAGSTNSFQVAVVTGTPTAGASLSNLNGHGAVPASSLVLGYVLVPNGVSNITSGDISNRATLVAGGLSPFEVVNTSVNVTAADGQCIVTGGVGGNITVTLPSHSAGQMVAIVNATPAGNLTTVSGTAIYGPGLTNATSFPLGTIGEGVILIDNGTAWSFLCGQQDTGWVSLTPATNVNAAAGRTPAARLLGDRVWFRGGLTNNTGSAIGSGGAIATINSPIPPPPNTTFPNFQGLGSVWAQVTTGNAIQGSGSSFPSGVTGYMDGWNYSLT